MFTVTPALKEHLVKTFGLKADASDEDAQKLAASKYASGELTADKLKELTTTGAKDKAKELAETIAVQVATAVAEAVAAVNKKNVEPAASPEDKAKAADDALEARFKEMRADFEKKMDAMKPEKGPKGILALGADLSKEDDPVAIRVKRVTEKYKSLRTPALRNAKSRELHGKPILRDGASGAPMSNPSDLSKVMAAVWMKYMLCNDAAEVALLPENDKALLAHILKNEKFIVPSDQRIEWLPATPRNLRDDEIEKMWTKATVVIADNTSGGNYATPEFFDTDFILLPILGNELAPLCNIVDVARGKAAQGFTLGNPTWTSGSTDGSAVNPFSTDSLIADHDTTFFRAAGAIRFGLNFLEDAVPGMADAVMGRIMAKANEWLDEQVAIGDGSTEPEGIFTATGTVDVTLSAATTGPYVIGDVLELLFGVTKPFREAYQFNKGAFVMTDPTYQLIRGLATGITGDARLIFGMQVEDYMLFGHPVAIVGTGLTNDQLAFVQCGGYRLYRRQGPRFRRSTEGSTNILANMLLMAYDMRFGGQLDRGGYAAVANSGVP